MNRDKRGRFARTKKWLKRIGVVCFLSIMGGAIYGDHWVGKQLDVVAPQPALAAVTMEAKVAATKDELVESLAQMCETKDVKEPDAAIILDVNNQMSIGAFMYQIKTVQQYEKQLYGHDVSRVEAIQIAIDHTQSAALTKDILFKVDGGYGNWANCARSLNLPVQIELLKKLDS